jgi:hypothetical protein
MAKRIRKVRMTNKNTPDMILKVWDAEADVNVRVGAGWVNDAGGFSIRLNRCVTLDWRDFSPKGELFLTLWPNDGDQVFGGPGND